MGDQRNGHDGQRARLAKNLLVWWVGTLILAFGAGAGVASTLYEKFRIPKVEGTIHKDIPAESTELPELFNVTAEYFQVAGVERERWLRGLAEYQKGNGFAVELRQNFANAYKSGKVRLTAVTPADISGAYAFVVSRSDSRQRFEALQRLDSPENEFVVQVPLTQPGDQLLFLVAVGQRVDARELQGLFALRKVK